MLKTPWNTELNITKKRQDYKICILWGVVLVRGGGGRKEIKMRVYGG
jgi:hypothetical protein